MSWDLTEPMETTLSTESKREGNRWFKPAAMVAPGNYTVTLYKDVDGQITQLGIPQEFRVERIRKNVLDNPMQDNIAAFKNKVMEFSIKLDVAEHDFMKAEKKVKAFEKALQYAKATPGTLENEVMSLRNTMLSLKQQLFGNSSKKEVGEKDDSTVSSRLGVAKRGFFGNTYGPTKMQMASFEMAKQQYSGLQSQLQKFLETDVPRLEKMLIDAGAPPIVD